MFFVFPGLPPDDNQEGQTNGIELASMPSNQGEPDTSCNPRENCSLAPNEGQEDHESQESPDHPDPSFQPEDIEEEEEAELPIPPLLQKTISPINEVQWQPPVEAETTPIRKGVLKNSGILPPVVPYKSPRKEVRQSPHRRIKKLHRSKTAENADLNGHEHVVTPVSWWGKSINVTLIVCAATRPKSNFVTTVYVMQYDPEKSLKRLD